MTDKKKDKETDSLHIAAEVFAGLYYFKSSVRLTVEDSSEAGWAPYLHSASNMFSPSKQLHLIKHKHCLPTCSSVKVPAGKTHATRVCVSVCVSVLWVCPPSKR